MLSMAQQIAEIEAREKRYEALRLVASQMASAAFGALKDNLGAIADEAGAELTAQIAHLTGELWDVKQERDEFEEWKRRHTYGGCALCGSGKRGNWRGIRDKTQWADGDAPRICPDCFELVREVVHEDDERAQRWRRESRLTEAAELAEEAAAQPTQDVYFARSLLGGDLIKIGISANVASRMRDLKAEAVLVIPGGRSVERALHERFAEHREIDEWFRPDPEILAFIEENRAEVAA